MYENSRIVGLIYGPCEDSSSAPSSSDKIYDIVRIRVPAVMANQLTDGGCLNQNSYVE